MIITLMMTWSLCAIDGWSLLAKGMGITSWSLEGDNHHPDNELVVMLTRRAPFPCLGVSSCRFGISMLFCCLLDSVWMLFGVWWVSHWLNNLIEWSFDDEIALLCVNCEMIIWLTFVVCSLEVGTTLLLMCMINLQLDVEL